MSTVVLERGRPVLYWSECSRGCAPIRMASILTPLADGQVELDSEAATRAIAAHLRGSHGVDS